MSAYRCPVCPATDTFGPANHTREPQRAYNPRVEYLLLGHMEVCAAGRPLALGGIKQRAVLAILLLNAGTCVDVDRLTELVWDDKPPAKPVTSLRAYVANLRRTLDDAGGGRRLITDATGYRLDTRADTVDIATFESLTASGRKALTVADPVAAERDLKAAIDLWRGQALADFRHQRFADTEIHRLGALRSVATEGYFEAGLLLGRDTELIAGLEDQLAVDPLHERVWGQLMLALYRSGRRAEALRAYHRARTELDTELGVRPGAALERLREDIANQSPDLEYAPLRVEITPVVIATEQRHGVVGRSVELTRLQGLLDRMARGHGSVAVIRGASGMGKTTLASAVIDDGTSRGMASAWSGQPDGVREPPMWAWVHIIRRLAERADPAALEQAYIVAPVIFQGLGSHDGAHTSHLTTEALESRFEAPTEIALVVALLIGRTPTIIVLDDLHRADKASRAVLDVLMSRLQQMPLLVLVTWRDGAADRPLRPRVFDRLLSRPDITVITLEPLTDQSMRDLVRAETGVEASAAFVNSLRKRTGGNPFYIRELARLLHTQGHLRSETTSVELAGMPDAVVGVVRRRMFDLPKRTRDALGIAGMIGVGVESQLLAEVLDITGEELRRRLAPACRIGLLSVSTEWPQRYWFSHDVVREVAVAEYPSTRKQGGHARIARAYAAQAETTGYDRAIAAAEHAWRAGGELEPEVASDVLDNALRRSVSLSEYADIAELTERALEMTHRLPEGDSRLERQARHWLQRATVLAVLRGHASEEATTALNNAFDAGLAMSTNSGFTAAVALRCAMLVAAADYREAGALGEGLLTLYATTGDPIAGAAGYYNRAVAAFMAGDLDAALQAVDDLVDKVPAQTQDNILSFDVRVFGIAAEVYALRGDVGRARAMVQNGIDMAHARGNGFAAAVLSVNLLQVNAIVGDVAGTAVAAADIIVELERTAGTADLLGSAHLIQAWARALEPGGPDTTSQIRDALLEHTSGGTRIFMPLYLMLLAEAETEHGHLDQARTTLHRATLTARASGERVWEQRLPARRELRPASNRLTESAG